MTTARAKTTPTLTPEARLEHAFGLIRNGIVEAVKATIDAGHAVGDWVDQNHSPFGKRKHLDLAREKKIPSRKVGNRVLFRRDDVNAYIERHGLRGGKRTDEEDVVDIVESLEAAAARPAKRRRRATRAA